MAQRPIVLSLTSIPPRFQNLTRKFRAIERQSIKPDYVELNIPDHYRRFPGEVPSLPPLPDWVSIKRCPIDYGPATKILPTAERWRGTGADILLCDDDRLPDCNWIQRFATARKSRPHDIITERGWNIDERFGLKKTGPEFPRGELNPGRGRILSYRLKRIASLGFWHPPRQVVKTAGYVDIFEGFLGALVPDGAFPAKVSDIPDIVWTVDDVWLSGMAYANGTKVWLHNLPRPVHSDGRYDRIAPLKTFVENGQGRTDADRLAVEILRQEHGAWP